MIESFVTQCPHCRTSFRVSQAQLGVAKGAVRCGACLQVFNAAQQLREQGHHPSIAPAKPAPSAPADIATPHSPRPTPEPQAAPTPATPASPPEPAPAANKTTEEPLWIHDDLDLDSLDLDEELAKLEEQENQLSQQFLEIKRPDDQAEHFLAAADDSPDKHDERWAEALLQDEAPRATPRLAPTASAPVRPVQPPAKKPNEPDANPAPGNLSASREEIALSAITDLEDEFDTDAPAAEADIKPSRTEPRLRAERLFELDDEPLRLDWRRPRKPWGRWIGWGLLNLLGASALAGQYLAYHFDQLARQDQYRPWFEQLCPPLGCVLPSKVDIEQIKSSNLVVRSHPEFSGALVVDAILYNRAPFTQPFPLLEIRFADLNGQLLASRRFKPSEYLAGELAGKADMPPQTPIHVSLEILDPGAQAVNYSLSFHSPE